MTWAVHLSDGVLGWPWLAGGFAVAGLLALLACRRMTEDDVPRVALMAAAFFVASSIHVKVGPTSVHLLLTGLVGVVLGWRAPLAVLVGVTLQALLVGHGGVTAVGINAAVQALPALLCGALFAGLRRTPFVGGAVAGAVGVGGTVGLTGLVLLLDGADRWGVFVSAASLAHVPLAAVEALVVGVTVRFLARVRPEMIGA
ncbi:MAG: CbiM family transporter [Gemmataceae bacterium]